MDGRITLVSREPLEPKQCRAEGCSYAPPKVAAAVSTVRVRRHELRECDMAQQQTRDDQAIEGYTARFARPRIMVAPYSNIQPFTLMHAACETIWKSDIPYERDEVPKRFHDRLANPYEDEDKSVRAYAYCNVCNGRRHRTELWHEHAFDEEEWRRRQWRTALGEDGPDPDSIGVLEICLQCVEMYRRFYIGELCPPGDEDERQQRNRLLPRVATYMQELSSVYQLDFVFAAVEPPLVTTTTATAQPSPTHQCFAFWDHEKHRAIVRHFPTPRKSLYCGECAFDCSSANTTDLFSHLVMNHDSLPVYTAKNWRRASHRAFSPEPDDAYNDAAMDEAGCNDENNFYSSANRGGVGPARAWPSYYYDDVTYYRNYPICIIVTQLSSDKAGQQRRHHNPLPALSHAANSSGSIINGFTLLASDDSKPLAHGSGSCQDNVIACDFLNHPKHDTAARANKPIEFRNYYRCCSCEQFCDESSVWRETVGPIYQLYRSQHHHLATMALCLSCLERYRQDLCGGSCIELSSHNTAFSRAAVDNVFKQILELVKSVDQYCKVLVEVGELYAGCATNGQHRRVFVKYEDLL